jgi:hypothetical protein
MCDVLSVPERKNPLVPSTPSAALPGDESAFIVKPSTMSISLKGVSRCYRRSANIGSRATRTVEL